MGLRTACGSQGAYYGPTEPWSDGIRIERLVRCDPR